MNDLLSNTGSIKDAAIGKAAIAPRRCSAFCTASSYRLKELLQQFEADAIEFTHFQTSHVVHRRFGTSDAAVFYFSYGTVVMWGLSAEEEQIVLNQIRAFEDNQVASPDMEEYQYATGETAKILKDNITIPSDDMMTKLAFSHGLAQSVKLGVFEKRIEAQVLATRYLPESLAQKGRIPLGRRDILKMMGQLFTERSFVNLHSDVLETPEFFWKYSDLEPLYRLIAQDLDIRLRVTVLNTRLVVLHELFDMLRSELDSRHSAKLEWIIIALIAFEILLGLSTQAFHLF